MLYLALTITSGNKETDLAVGLELKELVMKYAMAMGVSDVDLGPWLTHGVSLFDMKVLSSSLYYSANVRRYSNGFLSILPAQSFKCFCLGFLLSTGMLIGTAKKSIVM